MRKQIVGICLVVAMVVLGCMTVNARAGEEEARTQYAALETGMFYAQTAPCGAAIWVNKDTAQFFQYVAAMQQNGEASGTLEEMMLHPTTRLIGRGVKVLVTAYVENEYIIGPYAVYRVVEVGGIKYEGWIVSGHLEDISE